MALNIVWIGFFLVALAVALYRFIFLHDTEVFKTLSDGIFDSAKSSVLDVAFPLAGTMVFFLGLMNIAEKAGGIRFLSRLLSPLMKRLFPEVPKEHPAMGEMVMNFSANMLGLDNAATPFGLKAIQSLEDINPRKGTASNAQIMFIVLHTSGLTLIPLSVITYRLASGSKDPAAVFIPLVLATICTTLASVIVVGIKQRIRWDAVLVSWMLGLGGATALLLFWVNGMDASQKDVFGKVFGNGLLLLLITGIVAGGAWKKIGVFDAFIEGAKGGFEVVLKIIPYLVGLLVAIRVFRDCGALGYIVNGITALVHLTGMDASFTPSLPVALMRPFSASGARGLMLDVMKTYGPDSFAGKISCTLFGSAEAIFYIVALYFGSVGVKKVRYTIWAGLLSNLMGIITALIIGYIFYK